LEIAIVRSNRFSDKAPTRLETRFFQKTGFLYLEGKRQEAKGNSWGKGKKGKGIKNRIFDIFTNMGCSPEGLFSEIFVLLPSEFFTFCC